MFSQTGKFSRSFLLYGVCYERVHERRAREKSGYETENIQSDRQVQVAAQSTQVVQTTL
jgi:hypothetical protein